MGMYTIDHYGKVTGSRSQSTQTTGFHLILTKKEEEETTTAITPEKKHVIDQFL
jgi:hypothetical protein